MTIEGIPCGGMSNTSPNSCLAGASTNDNRTVESSLGTFSTVFTNAKAGMQDVDKEKVKRVVYDMSKNSVHHGNELRKQEKVTERIINMKAIQSCLSPAALQRREQEMQPLLAQLEAQRDLSHIWLHVDMDAFYAACEERDNPDLKSVPIAIGGLSMISTANYEARKFGVRAAMPGFIAIKLCPHLKFIKSDFKKYEEAASQVREVFSRFDPSFSARGLDEASLCITQHCAESGRSPSQVADQIRTEVHAKTGLTCSCGTAPNAMLAKICSDIRKPNGQFHVDCTREAVMAFIETLSVRKVPGIGRVSEQLLKEFGVTVVSDMYCRRALLSHLFSSISMNFFMHVALGLDSTQHQKLHDSTAEGRKSISHERTFAPLEHVEDLRTKIADLSIRVSQDLQEARMCGKCITLKLKQTDFRVRQRSTTLPTCIDSSEGIAAAANDLLCAETPIKVRLIGIKVSSLRAVNSTTTLEKFLRQAQKCIGDDDRGFKAVACQSVGHDQRHQQGHSQQYKSCQSDRVALKEACTASLAAPQSMSMHEAGVHSGDQHASAVATLCTECGAIVPQCDLQEHKDVHVAVALSRKLNGPSYLSLQPDGSDVTRQFSQGPKRKANSAALFETRSRGSKQGNVSTASSSLGRIDLFLSRRIVKE